MVEEVCCKNGLAINRLETINIMKGNTSLLRIPTNNCSASQQEGKKWRFGVWLLESVCTRSGSHCQCHGHLDVAPSSARKVGRSILTWSQEIMPTAHTASLPHPYYILTDAPSQGQMTSAACMTDAMRLEMLVIYSLWKRLGWEEGWREVCVCMCVCVCMRACPVRGRKPQ